MPKSSSSTSSQSSTTQTTENKDQRALADNQGVALSASNLNYTDQFSPEVAGAFKQLTDLTQGAGDIIISANDTVARIAERALDTFAKNQAINNAAATGQPIATAASSVTKDSVGITAQNMTKYIAIAAAIVGAYLLLRKGKK